MTIYEMFRLMAKACGMGGYQNLDDTLNLIDRLEKVNAFGTISGQLIGIHEFTPKMVAPYMGYANVGCAYCGIEKDKHE